MNSSDYVADQTDKMMDNMLNNTYWFLGLGAAVWFCGWIQFAGLTTVANRVGLESRVFQLNHTVS